MRDAYLPVTVPMFAEHDVSVPLNAKRRMSSIVMRRTPSYKITWPFNIAATIRRFRVITRKFKVSPAVSGWNPGWDKPVEEEPYGVIQIGDPSLNDLLAIHAIGYQWVQLIAHVVSHSFEVIADQFGISTAIFGFVDWVLYWILRLKKSWARVCLFAR